MGRKVETVVIAAEGRDRGKRYVICEMPASAAEEWAMRALEAMSQKSDIPAGLQNAGMLGIFILGLKPLVSAPWSMMKPLWDEMFDRCLSVETGRTDDLGGRLLRGAGAPGRKPVGPMVEEDMEEVATRLHLRDRIVHLHTGFSPAAVVSQAWGKVLAAAVSMRDASQSTQTSAAPSGPPSPGTQA